MFLPTHPYSHMFIWEHGEEPTGGCLCSSGPCRSNGLGGRGQARCQSPQSRRGLGQAVEGIIARRSWSQPWELCLSINKSFIMPLTACSSVPPWVLAACKGKGKASRESGLSRERGCWEPEVSHAPASSSQPTGPEWLPKPSGTLITAEESWLNGSSQVLGHLHLTALDFLPKAPFQEL